MNCLVDSQHAIPAATLVVVVGIVCFVIGAVYTRWAVKKNPGQLNLTHQPRYK
jgi:hypothetical protein